VLRRFRYRSEYDSAKWKIVYEVSQDSPCSFLCRGRSKPRKRPAADDGKEAKPTPKRRAGKSADGKPRPQKKQVQPRLVPGVWNQHVLDD